MDISLRLNGSACGSTFPLCSLFWDASRRHNSRLWLGENVAFMLDTFHDRRNGVEFGVTPTGGRYEGQVTNERWYNGDWNPVWEVAVKPFSGGWIAETAIPFSSLRYQPG